MTKQFCDFCGDEVIDTGKRAVLVILQPAQISDPFQEALSRMTGGGHADQRQMDMCAGCLGHLLPISRRVQERRTRRKVTLDRLIEPSLGVKWEEE